MLTSLEIPIVEQGKFYFGVTLHGNKYSDDEIGLKSLKGDVEWYLNRCSEIGQPIFVVWNITSERLDAICDIAYEQNAPVFLNQDLVTDNRCLKTRTARIDRTERIKTRLNTFKDNMRNPVHIAFDYIRYNYGKNSKELEDTLKSGYFTSFRVRNMLSRTSKAVYKTFDPKTQILANIITADSRNKQSEALFKKYNWFSKGINPEENYWGFQSYELAEHFDIYAPIYRKSPADMRKHLNSRKRVFDSKGIGDTMIIPFIGYYNNYNIKSLLEEYIESAKESCNGLIIWNTKPSKNKDLAKDLL